MVVGSRPGGADRLGASASRRMHDASARCRASASTTARRCTATATTTGARSTRPRAWPRARPAARCWSRARSSTPPGAHLEFEPHRRGPPQGLLRADRAVPRPRRRRMTVTADAVARARSRATGLLGAGAPVLVLLSGGRDSICLLDVAVALAGPASCARCTSTTGCAAEADADEAHCARAVRAARRRARGRARARRAGRRRQPAGVGARRALRAAARAARGARRAARRRAHGHRPGRDDPLPAGRLAGAARAAGHGRARDGPARPPAARRARASETARLLRGARAGLARGRDATTTAPTRATACATGCCRRCARSHPAAEAQRRCAPPRCCARRPRCSTSVVADVLAGRDRDRARPPGASCRRRWRGWSCGGWPRTRPAALVPAGRRARSDDVLALGGRRRARPRRRRARGRRAAACCASSRTPAARGRGR